MCDVKNYNRGTLGLTIVRTASEILVVALKQEPLLPFSSKIKKKRDRIAVLAILLKIF